MRKNWEIAPMARDAGQARLGNSCTKAFGSVVTALARAGGWTVDREKKKFGLGMALGLAVGMILYRLIFGG